MSWQILITIAVLVGFSSTLLQRFVQKNSRLNPLAFIIFPTIVATILIAIFAIIKGFDTRWYLIPKFNLFLSAVLWSLSNTAYVHALKRSQASQFGIIFTTRVLWTVLISIVFLNENLPTLAIAGVALLFISCVLAVWEEGITFRKKGVLLCLLSAALAGSAVANDGIVLSRGYDVASYFVMGFGFTPLILGGLSAKARSGVVTIVKSPTMFWQTSLLGVLYALGSLTLLGAFRAGQQLSVLASLNQTQTILVVLGAAVLLKERRYLTRRLIAAVIAFAGVLLIINS